MPTSEETRMFAELFTGNPLAIGTEEGGCKHMPEGEDRWWWRKHVTLHLEGIPCGVYPVMPATMGSSGVVSWGCVDWDEGPGDWKHAVNTYKVVKAATGATTWIEASRSKGFHLWWFVDTPVEMSTMRKALLAACKVVNAPVREVNPKQMELEPGQLGNYVRLPYPGAVIGPERPDGYASRTMYVPSGGSVGFEPWVKSAYELRSTPQAIETMATYYKEPVRVVHRYVPLAGNTYERLTGLARVLWEDGPLDRTDRSAQIYRFARILAENQHHTPDEMHALVLGFDERWFDPPKYVGRADQDKRVGELIDRVIEEGVEEQ